MANHCQTLSTVDCVKCTFDGVTATMGGDITATTPKPYGIFYLETRAESPFAIPHYRSFKRNIEIYTCKQTANHVSTAISDLFMNAPTFLKYMLKFEKKCCNAQAVSPVRFDMPEIYSELTKQHLLYTHMY